MSSSMNVLAAYLKELLVLSLWHRAVRGLKLKRLQPNSGGVQQIMQKIHIPAIIFTTSFLLNVSWYLPG